MPYAELHVTSNYSFLRGASHVEELFAQAAFLGLPALAITDRSSLAGVARAHQRAAETGVRLVVGCRLDLIDGTALLAYPSDRAAYARLCRLLTLGKGRTGKGGCRLDWDDLSASAAGLLAVLLPEADSDAALARLHEMLGDRAYVALTPHCVPGNAVRLARVAQAAARHGVATVTTGDVLYHAPPRRVLQDVLTCIREGCTIDEAGFRLDRHADRYLRAPAEMARLFARIPDAVARTEEIVARCPFSLSELRYQYPDEIRIPGQTPQQALESLVWVCAPDRYPDGVPAVVTAQLRHELALIAELDYAPYFLTVHSIVTYARSRGILCQGRGSAANSAVCWVIGITAIDPTRAGLLFERFVSGARREPPDIDVDFEHERREEVIQWVFDHYGRDRAALCATIVRYRARGAIREVGKALGLPEDVTGALASQVWGWSEEGVQGEHAAELNLNLADRRLRLALSLAQELIGFPRHMGTHPGGFVLTRDTLSDLVPIEPAAMVDRQVIEWDKDDIDTLRFMKVDVLGLGMLGCLRRCFDLLAEHRGLHLDMAAIPAEDSATFAMIQKADTLGTFQIESRAQMSMLPRLKPACLYDLTIQVAIVRPGPIQGDMVHPYLRRREGREPVSYPTEELRRVLGKTLGVPLFQEQAMQVAIVCAGFSPMEADQLRRSMATFKMTGGVGGFRDKLISGMVARGYAEDFAARVFSQIEGFGSYGFPESHAASFALVAYVSSWVKCHHPDVFCAALLNAQPMGFYAPAQIVRDARTHGVEVRPVCVNASRWDSSLEPTGGRLLAVRLGLRMVKGLGNAEGAAIVAARGDRPFRNVHECWRRSGVGAAALTRIAEADGFAQPSWPSPDLIRGLVRPTTDGRNMVPGGVDGRAKASGLPRRAALWSVGALADAPLPLFAAADTHAETVEPAVLLPPMTEGREVVEDYGSVGLTLRRHPVAFVRDELARRGCVPCAALGDLRDGRRLDVAGLVLVRQRPGSAKGVLFVTIEDETGIGNLIVWPHVFERQRRVVLGSGMLACRGRLQREGLVIHVIAEALTDLSDLLHSVGARGGVFPQVHGRGDEATHGGAPDPRAAGGRRPRDIYCPEVGATGIRVATRDFR